MRREHIGWLGAGLAASAAVIAQGACSKETTSNTGAGGSGGTSSDATTSSATTSSSSGSSSGTGGAGGSAGSSSSSSSSGVVGDSVLMHHKSPSRDGVYTQPALTKAAISSLHEDAGFNATSVQGAVYAQPLFVDAGPGGTDLVVLATETNNVYALDATTGAQVWTRNLGAPVALADLPCGNIDPFGVTGTPVIDFASRTLYLDAEITPDGGITKQHQVFALSLDDGSIKPGWPVDMATKAKSGNTTFTPSVQGQRGALALVGGTVYVPFGGLFGDCGAYHGWVVGISTADPTQVHAWVTTAQAGGVWAPNGISTNGTDLFVSTGNTQGTNVWGGGDAVIRLGAGALAMSAYFAPKNWKSLDNGDLDLGSGPILFDLPGSTPSALTIVFGKDGDAYLLDRDNLGGVTDPLGQKHVASNEIISAPVVYTTATATRVAARGNGFGCTSGAGDLLTLVIQPGSPPMLASSWCAAGGGGSPMVTTSDGHADAIVWTLGADGDARLHAFDGDTGQSLAFTDSNVALPGLRRYNTPIAAKGRIFVPVDGGVIAFTL